MNADVSSSLDNFLNGFDGAEADERFPNARHFYTGSLFVCHAGKDFLRIFNLIATPVLTDRYGDGYFLHNRGSGGSQAYKILVRAALHWCNSFIVVLTRNTECHAWVRAELNWLLRHRPRIFFCQFDDVRYELIHPDVSALVVDGDSDALSFFDFRTDPAAAQARLGVAIDAVLKIQPYPRFPEGPPGTRS